MGWGDSLKVFPFEVWEMILDRVYDSDTVYNVLQIYPELDEAFQYKKHEWILGKVLPFLCTWTNVLNEDEVLKLRLVYKNWLKQVDNFLENQQPHFRPYSNLQLCSWNSKRFIRNYKKNWEGKNYFGGVKLFAGRVLYNEDKKNDSEDFMEKFDTGFKNLNPFLARSLTLIVDMYSEDFRDGWIEVTQYFETLLKILIEFGKQVWFIKIEVTAEYRYRALVLNWLTRSFNELTNLKSLDLVLVLSSPTEEEKKCKSLIESCDDLSFASLESVRIFPRQTETFVNYIINGIKNPVKRLVCEIEDWKYEYARLVSNTTTEIKLESVYIESDRQLIQLRNVLLSIEAPMLVKLELDISVVYNKDQQPPVIIEDDIFQWLKNFPSLKYFDLGNSYHHILIHERGTLLPERDSIKSLLFLSIHDSFGISYNFLRCLPSLQHLQMCINSRPKVIDLSNEKVVKIREQIETGTMHKSNIWELLPKLKSVCGFGGRMNHALFFCDRESVNYCKKHPNYCGFPDFREDIKIWCIENGQL